MKKVRNLLCTVLALAMVLSVSASASALEQEKNYPENFMNMSVQQRIQWIEENIPAEVHEGTRINNGQRGNLDTFYATGHEAVLDPSGHTILAELYTDVEWTVDSIAPDQVQSYSVTRFDVYNYMSGDAYVVKEPVDHSYIYPGNLKVFIQATAFAPYIAYGMYNDYNLYSSGNFSLRSDHFAY